MGIMELTFHAVFQEVEKKLDTLADKDIGTILKTVGMTLVSTVGAHQDHFMGPHL